MFTGDEINSTKEFQFALSRLENIVGKKENAGCQYFLLFPLCFQKLFFSMSLQDMIM